MSIIVEGGKDIGWLQVGETDEETFLKQMFLEPAWQGQGIGSSLLADLIERGHRAKKPGAAGGGQDRIRPCASISGLA